MALRMGCLDLRLHELQYLTALFSGANAKLVQHSFDAAYGLSDVKSCANVSSLTDLTPLPKSQAARERIRDLSERLAEVNAVLIAGDFPLALEKAGAALEQARELSYRPVEAEALFQKGQAEERMGNWEVAAATLKEAVHAADAARMDVLRARAATHLVFVSAQTNTFAAGHEWAAVASSSIERTGGGAPGFEGQLLVNVGTLLLLEGLPDQATASYERARQSLAADLGREHPLYLFASSDLVSGYNSLGRYAEALALGKTTMEEPGGRGGPITRRSSRR